MGKLIKPVERVMLAWAGKIIFVQGSCGLLLTVSFDQIARGESSVTLGWLQGAGLLVFIAVTVFGLLIDKFMNELKGFLDKW